MSPCLGFVVQCGKETDFRLAVERRWQALTADHKVAMAGLASGDADVALRAAKEIHAVWQGSLKDMVGVDRSWANTHLHTRVGFHLSWIAHAQRYKVLEKGDSRAHVLNFGGEGRYRCLPFDEELVGTFQELARFSTAARLCGVAGSASEFEAVQHKLQTVASGLMKGVLEDETAYLYQWVLRGVQLAEGSLRDLGPLQVAKNFDLARFAKLFPGQNTHLAHFGKFLGTRTAVGLATKLGYDQDMFLLSMYLCLLCDARITALSPELLKSKKFKDRVQHYRKKCRDPVHKHEGRPAIVCELAAADCL